MYFRFEKYFKGCFLNGIEWFVEFSTIGGNKYKWEGAFENKGFTAEHIISNDSEFDENDDYAENMSSLRRFVAFDDDIESKISKYKSLNAIRINYGFAEKLEKIKTFSTRNDGELHGNKV